MGVFLLSSKTKIVVLHSKELIYTAVFAALGILLVLLLLVMFSTNKDTASTVEVQKNAYVAGVYTTSLVLNNTALDIEVMVDENNINSIRLINLDEAVTTMYPLVEPSFLELTEQIYKAQDLDNITYSEENKYTSMVLLDAIRAAVDKAAVTDVQVLP